MSASDLSKAIANHEANATIFREYATDCVDYPRMFQEGERDPQAWLDLAAQHDAAAAQLREASA